MRRTLLYLALVVGTFLATGTNAMLSKPSECGSSIGCFANCHDGDTNCKSLVTWSANNDGVDFELSLDAVGTTGNVWIALGLSNDESMGADSVTDCIRFGQDIDIEKSYNEDSVKSNTAIAPTNEGLSNKETSYAGGILTCKYRQSLTNTDSKVFDLNTDWNLLVAFGQSGGKSFKNRHEVAGDNSPKVSSGKVDLQSNEDVGSAVEVLVKVHGVLMIFGWMFCASIGIVLARFYKPMFPDKTICKEKVWFQYHRLCMITCLLVVAAGFVVIFVDVGGWAHLDGHTTWQKAHPYIGVIVTFCVVLNPMMALLRPHPEDKARYLFNWAHWFVGTAAHILSVMAIVLGITLGKSSVPFYVVWIVVGWAAYQAVFVLLMEMHECAILGTARKYDKAGRLEDPPGHSVKIGGLILHVLVITALTVVCIVLVAIN